MRELLANGRGSNAIALRRTLFAPHVGASARDRMELSRRAHDSETELNGKIGKIIVGTSTYTIDPWVREAAGLRAEQSNDTK